jgi:flavin-dependent dehydrogenase
MSVPARSVEHLVIGGGPAGSMLALRLAGAGREVTLLEKERGAHHKVCGEFLSREAVDLLRSAGIEPLDLGASPIRTVRLAVGTRLVEATLPFTALSLSRRVLDEALLARAAECGCNVVRGAHVESLAESDGHWLARTRGGGSWNSRSVFLASGKHDLAGLERETQARRELVGFKLHWRLAPEQTNAIRGAMELFLFTGGYGGLSLVENNTANLCLVERQSELRKQGGWDGLLASIAGENHLIAKRLQGATPLWKRPLAIFPIPYGYLAESSRGLWRLGDQAAVIHSFTGDGMSIALHSAALAARMFLAGMTAAEYQASLNAQLRRTVRLSTQISALMISGAGRALAPVALSLVPGAMRWIASSTRIPKSALAAAAAR